MNSRSAGRRVSSTNEWSPPPRVLHKGPRQEAASMTVCSNAVENLHIGALAREQETSNPEQPGCALRAWWNEGKAMNGNRCAIQERQR